MRLAFFSILVLSPVFLLAQQTPDENIKVGEKRDPLFLENETVRVGIDREFGGAITHLSWAGSSKNAVNIHDPGRLIQQSYYAGKRLDRTAEGQSPSWSPWPWNPIQGGGVKSWARVLEFEIDEKNRLFSKTIPKLWDMADEEAEAIMRQWTSIEPGLPSVVTARCELVCLREEGDRWGADVGRHQEIPALYFTRDFSEFRSYLGKGRWQEVRQPPGPPWGQAKPPLQVMACFNSKGQGIAVFSPAATGQWNFGPHGNAGASGATDAPCVHLAPLVSVSLGPRAFLRYRYWIAVGSEKEIAKAVDALLEKYGDEEIELLNL